jgi:hypothetical protein
VHYASPPAGPGHPNYALAVSGAVMFGVSYLFSVGIGINGLADDKEEQGVLLIPILGPVIFAAGVESEPDSPALDTILLVFTLTDTLFQGVGAGMFIAGMASTSRDDASRIPDVRVGPGRVSATWRF